MSEAAARSLARSLGRSVILLPDGVTLAVRETAAGAHVGWRVHPAGALNPSDLGSGGRSRGCDQGAPAWKRMRFDGCSMGARRVLRAGSLDRRRRAPPMDTVTRVTDQLRAPPEG